MRHLVSRSEVYRELTGERRPGTPEGRFLRNIAVLDTSTVLPLLLWLVTRYSETDRADSVAALDSYLMRRTLCRDTTKNYNRLFLDLLRELKAKDDPAVVRELLLRQDTDSGYWPDDADVRRVFREEPLYKQLTRARLRLIYAELEEALYDGKTERIVYSDKLTVEHLMPRAWEANWPLPQGGGPEAAESRRDLLHTAGNLTLLTHKLNPSVSNGAWVDKREEILLYSALTLNRSLPPQWDERLITARSDELAAVFCARWPRAAMGTPQASPPIPSQRDDTEAVGPPARS